MILYPGCGKFYWILIFVFFFLGGGGGIFRLKKKNIVGIQYQMLELSNKANKYPTKIRVYFHNKKYKIIVKGQLGKLTPNWIYRFFLECHVFLFCNFKCAY